MGTKKVPGIYLIADVPAQKCYIGSSVDLQGRLREHRNMLLRGAHHNAHLQHAFNKRGAFHVIPIPISDGTNVLEVEQALLDEFHPAGALFNIAKDATMPTLGTKASAETRAKLSAIRTGKTPSEETRQKLSEVAKARDHSAWIEASAAARRGKTLSQEHIEQVRKTSTERMQDPVRRELSGTAMLGKKHTPESIQKMKDACKGRKPSPQAHAALALARAGRKSGPA